MFKFIDVSVPQWLPRIGVYSIDDNFKSMVSSIVLASFKSKPKIQTKLKVTKSFQTVETDEQKKSLFSINFLSISLCIAARSEWSLCAQIVMLVLRSVVGSSLSTELAANSDSLPSIWCWYFFAFFCAVARDIAYLLCGAPESLMKQKRLNIHWTFISSWYNSLCVYVYIKMRA